MKKLIIFITMMLFVSNCFASFHIEDGALSTSNFYDFQTSDMYFGGAMSFFDLGHIISVDIGLISNGIGVAFMSGISFNILEGCKKLGWNYNLLEPVNIGGYYARDFENRKNIYGLYFGLTWGNRK